MRLLVWYYLMQYSPGSNNKSHSVFSTHQTGMVHLSRLRQSQKNG